LGGKVDFFHLFFVSYNNEICTNGPGLLFCHVSCNSNVRSLSGGSENEKSSHVSRAIIPNVVVSSYPPPPRRGVGTSLARASPRRRPRCLCSKRRPRPSRTAALAPTRPLSRCCSHPTFQPSSKIVDKLACANADSADGGPETAVVVPSRAGLFVTAARAAVARLVVESGLRAWGRAAGGGGEERVDRHAYGGNQRQRLQLRRALRKLPCGRVQHFSSWSSHRHGRSPAAI
jgi:hypothetical protein